MSTLNEYAETTHRAAHLDGQRRGAGAGLRRGPLRRARRSGSAPAGRLRHRHRRGRQRDLERQRQPADRHDLRRGQDVHGAGQRQAAASRRRTGPRSSRIATAIRCDSTRSPTSTTASRTTRPPAGINGDRACILAIQKQPGTNVVAVVDAVQAAVADIPRTAARRRSCSIVRSDRAGPIRESVRDVKLTLLSTVALVILVIFLFLRNISATIIPSLALPGSIVATFTVMYLLGLQPRQPVADGAHALGRLRRGRRDRDAREHRPAHGDGQDRRCRRRSTDRRRSRSRSSR